MKKLVTLLLVLSFFINGPLCNNVYAQNGAGDDILKNTQNDLILVGAAGAVGAVLGLSTLSFVERPSQHIYNIWAGASIGVIAGVIFVAYNSAQRGSEELQSSHDFNSTERFAWHSEKTKMVPLPSATITSKLVEFKF